MLNSDRGPNQPRILVVDDDALVRRRIKRILEDDYTVIEAASAEQAEREIGRGHCDLILLDLNLGAVNGLDLLKQWPAKFTGLDIVVCSGSTHIDTALECVRRGASDFIPKPFDPRDVLWIIKRVLELRKLRTQADRLNCLVHPHPVELIGRSQGMLSLKKCLESLRGHDEVNVMLLGESGVGKEIVARALHQQEGSSERPFVIANMPAIPTSLVESELFGVERGAFTDAKLSRAGKFEAADGGDIFLDEIGEVPLDVQPKLLRTLQEKTVERIGASGRKPVRVRFRVICATNSSLADLLGQGRFREDLIYRLSEMVIRIPPLRERMDDLEQLAEHFIKKHSRDKMLSHLSSRALNSLRQYSWPGNIRQLESTIKRALIFNEGRTIDRVEIFDPNTLTPHRVSKPSVRGRHQSLRAPLSARKAEFEFEVLAHALEKHGGDRKAACQELGLSRATFYRKLSAMRRDGVSVDV